MAPNDALAAIDRALRDIMKTPDTPFGGKVLVLGGDFRQVLPVIPRATRLQIIRKSLKSSPLMAAFKTIHLTENKRAAENEEHFSQWLLQLGSDELQKPTNAKSPYSIVLPPQCVSQNVIDDIFPQGFNPNDVIEKMILTPLNEDARQINEQILHRMQGEMVTLKSIDSIKANPGEDDQNSIRQQM